MLLQILFKSRTSHIPCLAIRVSTLWMQSEPTSHPSLGLPPPSASGGGGDWMQRGGPQPAEALDVAAGCTGAAAGLD